MPSWDDFHGNKTVRAAPITRIEEASADPAQPRRLFIAAEAEGIDEEEFLPTDPEAARTAEVGDMCVIDDTATHHVISKDRFNDPDKKPEPATDPDTPVRGARGQANRPATEVNMPSATGEAPNAAPSKKGG